MVSSCVMAVKLVEEATYLVYRKKKTLKRLRSEIIFRWDTLIDIVYLDGAHHLKVPELSEIPHELETNCSKLELKKGILQPKRAVPSWTLIVHGYVIEQYPSCLSPRILIFSFFFYLKELSFFIFTYQS